MESVLSLTNNQLNNQVLATFLFKKENRHGKYKHFATKSDYNKWYYSQEEKREKAKIKQRERYWKNRKPRIEPSIQECIKTWKYKNFYKCLGFKSILKWGHRKDGTDAKKCSCSKPKNWSIQKFLKVIHTWKLNRGERRKWSECIEFNQAGIALGVKRGYEDYRIGCIDIDCRGYTGLFKRTMYVSNRIGSVHFYFLYKENDLGKENKKIEINDFKADFKMCQYVMAPLSLHKTGSLYRIRGIGKYIIRKEPFEKASEAYNLLIRQVKNLQYMREYKKQQRLLKLENKILQLTEQANNCVK